MALPLLATVDDYTTRTGTTLDAAGTAQVTALLGDLSELVREAAGQTISLVTDDTVTLVGTQSPELRLPQRPVVSVSTVLIQGTAVGDWTLNGRDILWRPLGWATPYDGRYLTDWPYYYRGQAGLPVDVTYTHGYTQTPSDIVGFVVDKLRRYLANPAGLRSVSIDDYTRQFAGPADEVIGLTLSAGERRWLRRRFGKQLGEVALR